MEREAVDGAGGELYQKDSSDKDGPSTGITTIYEVVRYDSTPLSVRHHDKDTTEPISFYLSNLEELLSWKPSSQDAFNVCMVPLAERLPSLQSKRPRTLVCHDLMGGYLEDRFIQGSDTRQPYAFYHWQYIDIFVYFSHRMFTVPPVGWTNAAHRHGVSVLGTFITEWDGGGQTCERFLAGEEATYCAVADQLVQIAQFYQFDGWLINIENVLSSASVKNAPRFLRYLTDQLHAKVPGGLIIWYDSVIQDGELKWQNELNERNRIFFQSCDGIFTNYNWKEENLEYMLSEAGDRLADVYVGVDVFARGEVVGGRYETNKALQLIRKYGMSAAIFAPGWVYECLGKENFLENENKFWSLLEEHLPTHSFCSLPITTSFCLGFGQRRFSYGKEVDVGAWCNLSVQEMQPLFVHPKLEAGEVLPPGWVKTLSCHQDAWHGGCSLLLEGSMPPGVPGVSVRLFSLQIAAPSHLLLSMVYKLEKGSDVQVALELTTQDVPSCLVEKISEPMGEPMIRTQHPPALADTDPSYARVTGPCMQQSDSGWTPRCYEVKLQDCHLQDLFIHVSRPPSNPDKEIIFTCRLGEIRVVDAAGLSAPQSRVQDLRATHVLWRRDSPEASQLYLSLTLHWSYPLQQARQFRIFCRGVTCHRAVALPSVEQPHLIGLAHAAAYRVVNLAVPEAGPGRRLEFSVQPVTRDGFMTMPAQWGRIVLEYSDRTHTLV
ncbi:cytosolic endo-beta-N-acetylglucosaminidase [Ambystoma mexicanum]|uniref:cytosolic endo-beta-N-acetylglucosaminidase n=1 Tax=Ambystoma mexicanum TaxID=8296 RepID=UPI0037E93870